jgi:drug/metabolite transporter (DMT)-like permease
MLAVTYSAAILAALLNASAAVIERLATAKPDAKRLFSHHFVYEMIKSRLFLSGFGLQVLAFVFQAIALKNGPLIIVMPLMTSDLVFLLLLIHWKLGIHIKLRDVLSVLMIILGLAGLFAATTPTQGNLTYNATPWFILVSIVTPLVVILALIIRKLESANLRALLAGFAAAISYAMNAVFVKLSLNLLNKHGWVVMLTRWPIYALIVSGLISVYLMLNAYGSGPLAISQPVMEVFEPGIAVSIGILIFGDSYKYSLGELFLALLFVLLLAAGIVSLGSSPRIQEAGERGI